MMGISLSAQSVEYKLDFDDISLNELIEILEKEYGLLFSYKLEDIKEEKIDIHLTANGLNDFLDQLNEFTDLRFELLTDNYVLIKPLAKIEYRLCGTVRDAISHELLSYANVYLKDGSIGVSANDKGYFDFKLKATKGEKIVVSYIGYKDQIFDLTQFVFPNCFEVSMENDFYEEAFLVITDYITEGIDLSENGSSTLIMPRSVDNIPGSVEPDVMEIIRFLPGINSPSSKSADIQIRGCSSDQNLVIWEDIPIYHSAHYFGSISAFNPFIIDKMEIYRGGFGAQYGGRIAGVIDIKSFDENRKDNLTGIGSNLTHSYLYGHRSIGKKGNSSLSFSARRSYADLIKTPTYQNITKINQQGLLIGNKEVSSLPSHIRIAEDFTFADYNFKLSSKISDKTQFEFAGLYVTNKFSDEISDNKKEEAQIDSMNLENIGLKLKMSHQWSNKLSSEWSYISTRYEYDYDYDLRGYQANKSKLSGQKNNMIKDSEMHFTNNFLLPNNQNISLAYQWINYEIDFKIEERAIRSKDIDDQAMSTADLHAVYFDFKRPISSTIGVNAGLRANYFTDSDRFYLEPRLRIAYAISDYLSVHANYGRHHQFVSQLKVFRGNDNGISTELWALASKNNVPVQKADVYQFGFLFEKNNWLIDFQLFKRNIAGLSSRSYDFEIVDNENAINGDAFIQGVDLMLKKDIGKWKGTLSYSLSKSEYLFKPVSNQRFPSVSDQRHNVQFTNHYKYNDLLFGIGLRYSSGLPFSLMTDFIIEMDNNNVDQYIGIYDGLNQYRLDPQIELNASIQYNFYLSKKIRGYLCFSVVNLLNHENIYSRTFEVDAVNNQAPAIISTEKSALRLTPNLSFRMEW